MNLSTEKEFVDYSEYFTHKLRDLYDTDQESFRQIADFIPNMVYVSKELPKQHLDYIYFNNSKLVEEVPIIKKMLKYDPSLLSQYSCPVLLNSLKDKVADYKKRGDISTSVRYFEYFKIEKGSVYLLTNKILTKDQHVFLNFSDSVTDLPYIGNVFKDIFEFYHKDFESWQKFQSITQQERKVIRYICQGHTNGQISEKLFVTAETVKSHRKNIYKKLDINTVAEMVNLAYILDLERPLQV